MGCVGRTYTQPKNDFINGWQSGWNGAAHVDASNANALKFETTPAAEKSGSHWADFQDEELKTLLRLAQQNNNDLQIANTRIAQARADERGDFAALMPQISGSAGITRETVAPPLERQLDTEKQAGFNGSWDLDIAGGNKSELQAAHAGVQAALQDKLQTELTLNSDVARNYIELRSQQQQYVITQQNLDMQNYTLVVTSAQRALGAISDFEVARAKAQVQDTAARLPPLEKSIDAAVNRLSVLTGSAPPNLAPMLTNTKPIPGLSATAVVAMPLDIIARRPDIESAERRLAQAAALRNAAFAEYFPKISLQGFWGRQRSDFYDMGGSLWNLALNATMPLIDFGAIRAKVNLADSKQNEAFYTYRKTVLEALEETDNAITAYLTEIQRRDHLRREAASYSQAASIALEQYKAGTTTQLDLLLAERDKLDADINLAESEAAVSENLVLLYRALGENWQDDASNSLPPPSVQNLINRDSNSIDPNKPLIIQ